MSTQEYLLFEIRLLIAQFGRRTVLDALAASSELSFEELQAEISRLEAARKSKPAKVAKSLKEILETMPVMEDHRRQAIFNLAHLFDSKQFLPNLRDAEEFLRRNGGPTKKYKSRRFVLIDVLQVLSAMPQGELDTILSELTVYQGQSDYSILAKQLMGKSN